MSRERLGIAAIVVGTSLAAVGVVAYANRSSRKRQDEGSGVGGVRGLLQGNLGRAVDRRRRGGMLLEHHRDPRMPIKKRVGIIQDLVWDSVRDPRMRKLALQITQKCRARDAECEARAIHDWTKRNIRYTGDVAPVKMGRNGPVEGVDLFQSAFRTVEFKGGDCLPFTTPVLRDDYALVRLLDLEPGDRIFDGDGWTTVQERWLTGEKPLLAFDLSNGCTLRCSPDHRIFRIVDGRREEIRAHEARIGDDLVVGDTIPGTASPADWPSPFDQMSPEEKAWLLGVYVADGWHEVRRGDQAHRIAISGADGHPKEAQKQRVKEILDRIGQHSQWADKYIRVNHAELARFLAPAGRYAHEKRVPDIGAVDPAQVKDLLDGLAADATYGGRNGAIRTYGTTSPDLAMQLRILHRMLGQGVHIRRVDDHGGLGKHPVYRVTVRENPQRLDTRYARIRGIRDDGIELCADITVDSGKFWLPESDVVAHNCDDHSVLNATLLALNGITPKLRVTAPKGQGRNWAHIYVMAGMPKNSPKQWKALDTTLPMGRYGTEAPYGQNIDFAA